MAYITIPKQAVNCYGMHNSWSNNVNEVNNEKSQVFRNNKVQGFLHLKNTLMVEKVMSGQLFNNLSITCTLTALNKIKITFPNSPALRSHTNFRWSWIILDRQSNYFYVSIEKRENICILSVLSLNYLFYVRLLIYVVFQTHTQTINLK